MGPNWQRSSSPVDGKLGIIVGADGELTVVDLNGNIVPECRLSGIDHSDGKEARQAATDLPTCRGTIGTTIKKVTLISVTNHTGSNCFTISGVSSGYRVVSHLLLLSGVAAQLVAAAPTF